MAVGAISQWQAWQARAHDHSSIARAVTAFSDQQCSLAQGRIYGLRAITYSALTPDFPITLTNLYIRVLNEGYLCMVLETGPYGHWRTGTSRMKSFDREPMTSLGVERFWASSHRGFLHSSGTSLTYDVGVPESPYWRTLDFEQTAKKSHGIKQRGRLFEYMWQQSKSEELPCPDADGAPQMTCYETIVKQVETVYEELRDRTIGKGALDDVTAQFMRLLELSIEDLHMLAHDVADSPRPGRPCRSCHKPCHPC